MPPTVSFQSSTVALYFTPYSFGVSCLDATSGTPDHKNILPAIAVPFAASAPQVPLHASTKRDVRVPNTNCERRVSRQAMFAAPTLVDDVPLATASCIADACPAPAASHAASIAVTQAKTSHIRRTTASRRLLRVSANHVALVGSAGHARRASISRSVKRACACVVLITSTSSVRRASWCCRVIAPVPAVSQFSPAEAVYAAPVAVVESIAPAPAMWYVSPETAEYAAPAP